MDARRQSRPRLRFAVWIAAAALVTAPTSAADSAVLVLEDGQEIRGVALDRSESGEYLLTLETGATLTLPASLVTEVRLGGEGDGDADAEPAGGAEADDADRSDGPEAPPGFVVTEGRELTGAPTDGRTPPLSERLAAFPESGRSRFRGGAFDPTWTPTSDWDASTDVTQFNPARWYRAPIDPTWTPTSGFAGRPDAFAGRAATFPRDLIDPRWTPSSGFGREDRDREPPQAPPLVDGGRYVPTVRFDEP